MDLIGNANLTAIFYFQNETKEQVQYIKSGSNKTFESTFFVNSTTVQGENRTLNTTLKIVFQDAEKLRNLSKNVLVYYPFLTNCNTTFNTKTLQLIVKDEVNNSQITPSSLQINIAVWIYEGFKRVYSLNSTDICLYPTWGVFNALVEAMIRADGYALAEHYPYSQSLLSNQTQSLTLYMLPSQYAAAITFNLPNEGYILVFHKSDMAGNSYYIRSSRADFNKKAIIYAQPYDVYYKIFVYNTNRTLCFVSSIFKIASSEYTVTSCNVNISIPQPTQYIYKNINATCNFDNSTNTLTCSFISLDNLDHNVTLTIYKIVKPFKQTLFYRDSKVGVSGEFTAVLNETGEYYILMESHSEYDAFNWLISKIPEEFRDPAVNFLISLFFIACALMGAVEPLLGFGGIIMGFIIGYMTNTLTYGTSTIIAFTIIFIFGIYLLRKRVMY